MDTNRASRKCFENASDGRRCVGRPNTRWIDRVQADLTALSKRNGKTLAHDRIVWKNLLEEAKSKKWM